MFSSLRGFLYRHRRKFMWAGVTVGGAILASKLAEWRLRQWQEDETRKFVEQKRRKQHYERTLDTTRLSFYQLLPNIRKVLDLELDSDVFIRAIKSNPERKREYWEQLKLVGFGRVICTVVCSAITAAVSHVLLTVLAASTIDDDTPEEVQTKFLATLQGLVEEKLPGLVEKIMAVASKTISPIPLTRKLTLTHLEVVLQEISLAVTNDREASEEKSDGKKPLSILPWSRYLPEPDPIHHNPDYQEQLRKMYLTTVDILNTDDFNDVVNALSQVGVSFFLDEIAAFYFSSCFTDSEQHKPAVATVNQSDEEALSPKKFKDELLNSHEKPKKDSLTLSSEPGACSLSSSSPNPDFVRNREVYTDVPSCVVAKLVPVLSGLLHVALPNPPANGISADVCTLYHRLVACSQLEALAFSVYDALVLTAARPAT